MTTTEQDPMELAIDTLAGDVRDALLTHVRSMGDPWAKMSEQAQGDKIDAISETARDLVRRAVTIAQLRGVQALSCQINKFTVKDGIKAELAAMASASNIERMAEHIASPAVLVFLDIEAFMGERAPAKPDKDEPVLPGVDEDEEAGED